MFLTSAGLFPVFGFLVEEYNVLVLVFNVKFNSFFFLFFDFLSHKVEHQYHSRVRSGIFTDARS